LEYLSTKKVKRINWSFLFIWSDGFYISRSLKSWVRSGVMKKSGRIFSESAKKVAGWFRIKAAGFKFGFDHLGTNKTKMPRTSRGTLFCSGGTNSSKLSLVVEAPFNDFR
jgi:hypothetical protein